MKKYIRRITMFVCLSLQKVCIIYFFSIQGNTLDNIYTFEKKVK